MKSIKQIVKSGAMLLALSLVFTSCDELMGELDNLAPSPVTPTPEPTPELETPLTLEAAVAGAKVTFKANNNDAAKAIEYSDDGGKTWKTGNTGGDGVEVTLQNVGDKVMFRGNNTTYSSAYDKYNNISCTADCYVYGNIMSLINAENFATLKELPSTGTRTFNQLFYQNTHLKNHPNAAYTLELPATKLTDYCYRGLFWNCTSLVMPPVLPATELKKYCYVFMFEGCTSLATAPELPAATLAQYCYQSMFKGCTSLATAPALPATTLAYFCYYEMFCNCTSLATAPALPVTELNEYCYALMFSGCTSLETTPKLPATELKKSCYADMFNGCTSLKEAWVKAAYTNTNVECKEMFTGCTNATTSKFHTGDTKENWTAAFPNLSNWQFSAY